MIEFYGKISKESIAKTSKRQSLVAGFVCLIPTTLLAILVTVFGIFQLEGFNIFLGWTICFAILNLLFFILPLIMKPKTIFYRLPRKITIDSEIITVELDAMHGEWKPKIREIEKVKVVIDYGECFDIVFRGDTSWWWVCQKDLITKGTIEDFEKLFEGKIKRNSKV